MFRPLASFVILILATVPPASADESLKGIACRSVHLAYDAPLGTAFYNELDIERSAPGTFFMVCGWTRGYFGLQELANSKKLVLFSVWDDAAAIDQKNVSPETRARVLHQGDDVRVGRFGNEGTGGQSFFDFDWQVGETYRFLVTAAPDGDDRTAYSGFFYLPEAKEWKQLVTFSTVTGRCELLRGHYSFVEDFHRNKVSATQARTAAFTNAWAKSAKGEWESLNRARFTADSNPVLSIDAWVGNNAFFLATGGAIKNTHTKLNESLVREASGEAPPDLPQ